MLRFGPFELDTPRRQLTRDGRAIHLTPKAFALLQLLVAAAPRVVPKAEIHDALWPRTVVADTTLVGLVKEVRRALDDTAADTPIIRTAHRVGYAFEAPLAPHAPSRGAQYWLVEGERRISLQNGENVVGRDPEATVWLDYASVSRRHARIVVTDGRAVLEDLGSKNGTTVGAERVAGARALRDGDCLEFGRVTLIFRTMPTALATVTQDWSTAKPEAGGTRT
jgi:DNA-binding winged helix-turn-helix (wHTH) protein